MRGYCVWLQDFGPAERDTAEASVNAAIAEFRFIARLYF